MDNAFICTVLFFVGFIVGSAFKEYDSATWKYAYNELSRKRAKYENHFWKIKDIVFKEEDCMRVHERLIDLFDKDESND